MGSGITSYIRSTRHRHPAPRRLRWLFLRGADLAMPNGVHIIILANNGQITIGKFVDWCNARLANAGVYGAILIIDSSSDGTPEIALGRGARVLRTLATLRQEVREGEARRGELSPGTKRAREVRVLQPVLPEGHAARRRIHHYFSASDGTAKIKGLAVALVEVLRLLCRFDISSAMLGWDSSRRRD